MLMEAHDHPLLRSGRVLHHARFGGEVLVPDLCRQVGERDDHPRGPGHLSNGPPVLDRHSIFSSLVGHSLQSRTALTRRRH